MNCGLRSSVVKSYPIIFPKKESEFTKKRAIKIVVSGPGFELKMRIPEHQDADHSDKMILFELKIREWPGNEDFRRLRSGFDASTG